MSRGIDSCFGRLKHHQALVEFAHTLVGSCFHQSVVQHSVDGTRI